MSFLPESYIPLRGHGDRANYFTKKLAQRLVDSAEQIRWSVGKKPMPVFEIEGHVSVQSAITITEREYCMNATRGMVHKAIELAQNYLLKEIVPTDT